jgi:hypothetical protein
MLSLQWRLNYTVIDDRQDLLKQILASLPGSEFLPAFFGAYSDQGRESPSLLEGWDIEMAKRFEVSWQRVVISHGPPRVERPSNA